MQSIIRSTLYVFLSLSLIVREKFYIDIFLKIVKHLKWQFCITINLLFIFLQKCRNFNKSSRRLYEGRDLDSPPEVLATGPI